jgi:hypothetical protein
MSTSTEPHTVSHILHDVGLAAWFGGALMGAIGLNGAANDVSDERDRLRVASSGWARWTPVNAAAIGAHLVGGAGLLVANRDRARKQAGVRGNTIVKTLLTGAALGATAYSRVLGNQVTQAGQTHAEGGTVPSEATPEDVARPQQQLRGLQWAIPALTGLLVVLGAQQGEQQKPNAVVSGLAKARSLRS